MVEDRYKTAAHARPRPLHFKCESVPARVRPRLRTVRLRERLGARLRPRGFDPPPHQLVDMSKARNNPK